MRKLFVVTAMLEVGAGLALACFPSATVMILLGSSIEAHPALTVGRLAGVALLSLGVACWLARRDDGSRAARGLISAMVLYNLGAVVILSTAGIRSQPVGVLLWPAVVLHAAMTVWCLTGLQRKPVQIVSSSES